MQVIGRHFNGTLLRVSIFSCPSMAAHSQLLLRWKLLQVPRLRADEPYWSGHIDEPFALCSGSSCAWPSNVCVRLCRAGV